jgi:hypothetical protein
MKEFAIWGELWQSLKSRTQRGFMHLAVRRKEKRGEALTNGLISGWGYPLTRLELVDGEMLCELHNPWCRGCWGGRWSPGSSEWTHENHRSLTSARAPGLESQSFWMSIQDFCRHFTEIYECRALSPYWQNAAVTLSTDRPSYPLVSVAAVSQAVVVATQSDRRWNRQENYMNSIGLRIYRCRITAPPSNAVGGRQNVSSPFHNLELLMTKPLSKSHSVCADLPRLEPSCLYVIAVDSQYRCPRVSLKVYCSAALKFRELSAPEASYFLQAQSTAISAADRDSFSSQGSCDHPGGPHATGGVIDALPESPADGLPFDWHSGDLPMPRLLKSCITSCSRTLQC